MGKQGSFVVSDSGEAISQYHRWRKELPQVHPFYAVKANHDVGLLQILSALGIGFDCANKGEIEMVTEMGVSPDQIVYSHPIKEISDCLYANDIGVHLTTFDSLEELHKIKQYYPNAQVMLRLNVKSSAGSHAQFEVKYGASVAEAPELICRAHDLGIDITGLNFQIGGCGQLGEALANAVGIARKLFDEMAARGIQLKVVDLGGGFPGDDDDTDSASFEEVARQVRTALSEHFPPESGVRIIAEPGIYFAASNHHAAVRVVGKKVKHEKTRHTTAVRVVGKKVKHEETQHTTAVRVVGKKVKHEETQHTTASKKVKHEKTWHTTDSVTGLSDSHADETSPVFHYYLSSGIHMLFMYTLDYKKCNKIIPLEDKSGDLYEHFYLWGPVLAPHDVIRTADGLKLPELNIGDWLCIPNSGAYSLSWASNFAGTLPYAEKYYIVTDKHWDEFEATVKRCGIDLSPL